MNEKLLYSHIPLSDLQANDTLLGDDPLRFVLLFYTLSRWQQQDQQKQGIDISPFLKIPRKNHIENPKGGSAQREKNVEAFKSKCTELLSAYREKLSEDQQELLSLNCHNCLPKFSTSFVIDKDQPILSIHYRGGKNMYRERVFADPGNPENAHINALKEGYKALHDLQMQITKQEKQLATIQVQYDTLKLKWWVFNKRSRLRGLENKLATIRQEMSVLEPKLDQEKAKQTAIEASASLVVGGGVIASGGNGVGRLVQQIPVIFKQDDEIMDIDVAEKKMILTSTAATSFMPGSAASQQSEEDRKQMKGILFRKVALNQGYPPRQDPKITIEEQRKQFEAEATLSKIATSGDLYIYKENPSTLKPEILTTYRVGSDLYKLQINSSISLKQRLVLLYLAFKGYKKKCLDQNYIHRDIKPDNLLVEREGNRLTILPCDYATAIFCAPDAELTNMNMVGTRMYTAPEGYKGTYSQKSDIFSFGRIVYDFLSDNYFDDSQLTRAEIKTIHSLQFFAGECMMHEDPQKRPSLQEVLNVFERQLHKYKIEPHTVEQQGMLFEYELPDKIDSISYQPSQQVFRL